MPAQRPTSGFEKKKRSKKRRTRTEVSSSESDSDVSTKKIQKSRALGEETEKELSPATSSSPASTPANSKKKSSKPSPTEPSPDQDTPMEDAPTSPSKSTKTTSKPQTQAKPVDEFSAIYLRKIASEFADDLDKVREAPDFKASSVPMLIHALKQGESLFEAGERRRVVRAGGV